MGRIITFLPIFLGILADKEPRWLVAILLLGNIAVMTYCLTRLFLVLASTDLREALRKGMA